MSRSICERLARLKRLRARLGMGVTSLGQEIAALDSELRAAGFRPVAESRRPNAARMNALSAGNAAEAVLRAHGEPMRLRDIVAAIERVGHYRSPAKDPRATIAAALARSRRFRKVRYGVYDLVPSRR